MLRKLLMSGVDVVRINFSHGDYDFYAGVIRTIRRLDRELELHTAILADLQGPKLRVGEMANGAIDLKEGERTGDHHRPGERPARTGEHHLYALPAGREEGGVRAAG